MRNRIARACSVLAAGVAVTSVIGFSAANMADAATTVKPAATPACGDYCYDLFSQVFGPTGPILNAYVPGDTGTGGKVGQVLNMKYQSNSHPNEDFTEEQVGTLADFCPNFGGTGLSSTSYSCINYPSSYPVYEADWLPYGNESGLCAGAALPLYAGENTSLQTCGTSASTLWVGDLANGVTVGPFDYSPLVNAADTRFSHQLTLTLDPGTTGPTNQLKLEPLNLLSGSVPDTQEFSYVDGPAPFAGL
jgi:hypothetical protein